MDMLTQIIMRSLYGQQQQPQSGYAGVIQNSGIQNVAPPEQNRPVTSVLNSQAGAGTPQIQSQSGFTPTVQPNYSSSTVNPAVMNAASSTPSAPANPSTGGAQTWQNSASNGAVSGGDVPYGTMGSGGGAAASSGMSGASGSAAMMMGQNLGNSIKDAMTKGTLQIPVPQRVPTATFGIPQITYGI
jgi:hypothetical protein